MEDVLVFERGEGIARAIRDRFPRSAERSGGEAPTLVVISPGAARCPSLRLPQVCRTVLLPGEAAHLVRDIVAESAVSYGASARDTLTVSSREGDRIWISLQRDLLTCAGTLVEQQEFSLPLHPGDDELLRLAIAGALLLMGVSPAQMEDGAESAAAACAPDPDLAPEQLL